jgi:putative endonuclease
LAQAKEFCNPDKVQLPIRINLMAREKCYVYILSGPSGILYTGMTNDLERRVYEHKHKLLKGFSSRFNMNRLVFFEEFNHAIDAIAAEKRIKGWVRKKKLDLIRTTNPDFVDLSADWFDE